MVFFKCTVQCMANHTLTSLDSFRDFARLAMFGVNPVRVNYRLHSSCMFVMHYNSLCLDPYKSSAPYGEHMRKYSLPQKPAAHTTSTAPPNLATVQWLKGQMSPPLSNLVPLTTMSLRLPSTHVPGVSWQIRGLCCHASMFLTRPQQELEVLFIFHLLKRHAVH